MTSTPRRIPNWLLERYVLGEASAAEREEVQAALARGAELAARIRAIETSNRELLQAYPAEREVPAIRARAALEAPRLPP